MPVLTEEKKRSGGVVPPRRPDGFDGDGGDGDNGSAFPISKAQLATWALITGVTMLFSGLISAYVVLRGVPTWQNIAIPPLVWVNTLVLIASSAALEIARAAVKRDRQRELRLWLSLAGILGLVFLGFQVWVWRQLVNAGVYLPTNLHSSFFYVLTATHGFHVLGGLGGLAFVLRRAFQGRLSPARHEALKLGALYWHFMDVVWIVLFLLLVFA